jgi:chromosome segregation ATPase
MKWTERREILFKVAGDIKDGEIIEAYPELKGFLNSLNSKSLEDFKKEMAARKKLLKDELSGIPARIDEVNRAILPDPDYQVLEKKIEALTKQINLADSLIASETKRFEKKNQDNKARLDKIYDLEQKVTDLNYQTRNNAEKAINELKLKKNELQRGAMIWEQNISSFRSIIRTEEGGIRSLTEENNKLRAEWMKLNEEVLVFEKDQFICSACGTDLTQTKPNDVEVWKEEMTASFNNNKVVKLKRITDTGKANKTEIERLNSKIQELKEQIEEITTNINKNLAEVDKIVIPDSPLLIEDPQVKVLRDQIAELRKSIETAGSADTKDLIFEKTQLGIEIEGLKEQMAIKGENEKRRTRLIELENQQKSLSQQIASLEKQEFQCEKFIRAKVSMVEEKVNSIFSLVKFKLFDKLINGGLEECCEMLIKGVPFGDINGAGKIQGGLDVIRILSKYYNVYAPVFIDNRESCTEIPEMDCQVISLIVDPSYKELKVITKN